MSNRTCATARVRATAFAVILAATLSGCASGGGGADAASSTASATTTATHASSRTPTSSPERTTAPRVPMVKVGKPKLTKSAQGWTTAHRDAAWRFATDLNAGWAFNPDLLLTPRDEVTAGSFTGLTDRLDAAAKKDFVSSLAKAKKRSDTRSDGPTGALALWGLAGSTYDFVPDPLEPVGPITITGEMADVGQYGTRVDQVIKTVLYTYQGEQRMQTPYTKKVMLVLTGAAGLPWHVSGWNGTWKVGDTVPAP